MTTRGEYLNALDTIRKYRVQLASELHDVDNSFLFIGITPETRIGETGLSVHITNVLKCFDIGWSDPVGKLSDLSLNEFSRARNIGPKAMRELMSVCFAAGIKIKS